MLSQLLSERERDRQRQRQRQRERQRERERETVLASGVAAEKAGGGLNKLAATARAAAKGYR